MPHEFALITAQKYDQSISNYAQQKQVIIVGTINTNYVYEIS